MGQEHLIKTITHSWRVGAKIMKRSKQVLEKIQLQTTNREGKARFFSALTRKIDTGLPALVVALFANRQIEIRCHVNGVESLFQFFERCFYDSVRNL